MLALKVNHEACCRIQCKQSHAEVNGTQKVQPETKTQIRVSVSGWNFSLRLSILERTNFHIVMLTVKKSVLSRPVSELPYGGQRNTKISIGDKKFRLVFLSPILCFASHRLPYSNTCSEAEIISCCALYQLAYVNRLETKHSGWIFWRKLCAKFFVFDPDPYHRAFREPENVLCRPP